MSFFCPGCVALQPSILDILLVFFCYLPCLYLAYLIIIHIDKR